MSFKPRYASVILDVDTTVSGIEGIDWLATRRKPDVAAKVADLTRRTMAGEIPFDAVYGERLRLVAPGCADIDALGQAYVAELAPGVRDAVGALRAAGVRVVLVSGGLREALLPLADALGIPRTDLHAVGVRASETGDYAGFDTASPLAANGGKPKVVAALELPRPILAVGDGITDAELQPIVDTFAAFTAFVRREAVVRAAAVELRSFAEVTTFVLGGA